MKKRSLVTLALAALLLSACGGGGETDTPIQTSTKYLITFKDEEGNLLDAKNWEEGQVPSYAFDKQDTAEWDYTFEGWSLSQNGEVVDISAASADATYYAVVSKVKQKYTVSFYDPEGQSLKSEKYEYGEVPSCSYVCPEDTAEWDYTFTGWSLTKGGTALASLPAVASDVSYYAVVTKAKQQYKITFKDDLGNTLTTLTYSYGETPSYTYNKQDTAEWDYTMEGWSASSGGLVLTTLPTVTGHATYYAVVSRVKQKYDIEFRDENNVLISSTQYEYGATPSCSYTGPTSTQSDSYTFLGWATTPNGTPLSALPTVSKAATYYAVVGHETQKYTIAFYKEDGTTLIESNSVYYGVRPSCSYTGPVDNQEWDYTFRGWSRSVNGSVLSEIPTVTGDATYYAVVNAVKNKYTVTFDSMGGSSVGSLTKDYGTEISKPTNPTKEGFKFVCWVSDLENNTKVEWPYTVTHNITLYAVWNEVIDMKGMLTTMMSAKDRDLKEFLPETMLPEYSQNHLSDADMAYDFTDFTNVSDIHYGGYGEQWNMVLENMEQSELFYSVLTLGDSAITASVAAFNNYFDTNPDSSADHSLGDTTYSAKVSYNNAIFSYTIQYKTGLTIPFFGSVTPQIDMTYDTNSGDKTVRIQLSENNAMKYIVSEDSYQFAIKYGVEQVSRNAICTIEKTDEDKYEGHIYEFVQLKDKDMVPSCADFYIDEDYVSVVGNKAGGLIGFSGYINELYKTSTGRLIGYKVQEELSFAHLATSTYHTLWFNLNNISGITSVKAVENENFGGGYTNKNPHDIYLNGQTNIFEPVYNKVAIFNTSRKYDVEMRNQYFFNYDADGNIVRHACSIPMMFIQDNHDDYHNYDDFESDILSKSSISASVNLSSTYLSKIRSDYETLIPTFKENVNLHSSATIAEFIGSAIDISNN